MKCRLSDCLEFSRYSLLFTEAYVITRLLINDVGKILITGGAGFIGTAFARYAHACGLDIVILDNLSSRRRSNFEELIELGINCVEGDVRDPLLVSKVLEDCHSVVHLAAKVSVHESIRNPKETMDVNVNGTQILLDECMKQNIRCFILASSAAVYGDSQSLPLREDDAGMVLSPYAESKLINEEQISQLRSLNCQIFALRFFNVYGNGQDSKSDYGAVIPTFIKQMSGGNSPILYGDGMQTRDFVHVHDVCRAIATCLNYNDSEGNKFVFNVAPQESTSLLELIGLINRILSESLDIFPLKPNFSETRKGDIVHSLGSIELIKSTLGWEPELHIYEGLSEMIRQGRD